MGSGSRRAHTTATLTTATGLLSVALAAPAYAAPTNEELYQMLRSV
ncbi:hypothetical protein [Methylorubrum thiocyanatum]